LHGSCFVVSVCIMKYIPDTSKQYSITNDGKVYSNIKKRFLSIGINNRGYHCVILHCAKHKSRLVHRLVAEAYLGKSNLTVNHKDGDKSNNCLDNLEYMTYKDNERHAYDIGLKVRKVCRDTLKSLYKKDLTYKEISDKLGCSRSQVKRLISEFFPLKERRVRQHNMARLKHYRKSQ